MPLNIGGTNITSVGVKVLNDTSPITGSTIYLDAGIAASYPGSGTTWTDLSGNGKNGTLANGPTFSTGSGGNITFDGTDDNCNLSFTWPIVFSLSLWIYPISAPGGIYSRVISTGPGDNFELAINSSRQISYYFPVVSWVNNVVTLASSQWSNLVFLNNSGTSTIYINGVSTYTGSSATATSGTSLYVGTRYTGGEPSNISVANIFIYGRALTATEILQNFQSQRQRFGI